MYEEDLKADPKILDLGIPVLGICYGMQVRSRIFAKFRYLTSSLHLLFSKWLAHHIGGEVKPGKVKEYGKVELELVGNGGDILNLGVSNQNQQYISDELPNESAFQGKETYCVDEPRRRGGNSATRL